MPVQILEHFPPQRLGMVPRSPVPIGNPMEDSHLESAVARLLADCPYQGFDAKEGVFWGRKDKYSGAPRLLKAERL